MAAKQEEKHRRAIAELSLRFDKRGYLLYGEKKVIARLHGVSQQFVSSWAMKLKIHTNRKERI